MKYQLTNLVKSLTKEEVRNFKVYSSRFKVKEDTKKLVQLFEYLRNDEYDEYDDGIVKILFPKSSKNAYYQLKNRLVREIEDSLLMLHKNKGDDYAVMRQLQLSKIFSDKGEYQRSKDCLQKANKLAKNSKNKILQCIIYDRWLDLESGMPSGNIKKVANLASDHINQTGFELKSKVLIASVKDELFRSNNSSKSSLSVIQTLDETVQELRMSDEYTNSAILRIQVSDSVKHVLLVKKQYRELVEFLQQELKNFREDPLFSKTTREQEVKYLSWIINALLRIRRISEVNQYIDELEELLGKSENQQLANKHKWLLFQCRLVGLVYSGKNKDAIILLSDLEGQRERVPHYPLMVLLNLGLLHYYENNLERSLDYLTEIIGDESFKKFATPLQITATVIELVIRIEKGDNIYALNRHKNIKRKYRNFLAKEEYRRDKNFLNILKDIINDNLKHNPSKKTKAKIEQFIQGSPPFEPGSNEALCYQLWLRAYLEKRNYYQLVLENINSEN